MPGLDGLRAIAVLAVIAFHLNLRRARRLLPALFLMIAAVVAWVTLLDPSRIA
jgi:peptidoglycan/LPS O-acetylase OafA/YrhL